MMKLNNNNNKKRINVIYDLETNDPDDWATLCILTGHPKVKLRAVTIRPGTPEQVGLVRNVLRDTNRLDVKVGASNLNIKPPKNNQIISRFHYRIMESIKTERADDTAENVIKDTIIDYPDCAIITGAPLTNLSNTLKLYPKLTINEVIIQGGFAGDNIVNSEDRLKKFDGKTTCRTFNFCSDIQSAKNVLFSDKIAEKFLVSKNVCHSLRYNKSLHKKVSEHKLNWKGLELLYNGMDKYLQYKRQGKMFHDPLAAMTAINRGICQFQEVKPYCVEGVNGYEWGVEIQENSNIFISTKLDKEKFIQTLLNV